MRSRYDADLLTLNRDLTQMGAMCEEGIDLAARALVNRDNQLAERVTQIETEIDQMERKIETLCLKLLLKQQPVATDLRQISAALKMITDMERIGDQAADIAEIIAYLEHSTELDCKEIPQMAEAACQMVTESIDAFVKQDLELAKKAIAHDDLVDRYFIDIKQSLIRRIEEKQADGEYALDLLMIAKYFERIGDHAVNIAEWVIFSVTGEHKGGQ